MPALSHAAISLAVSFLPRPFRVNEADAPAYAELCAAFAASLAAQGPNAIVTLRSKATHPGTNMIVKGATKIDAIKFMRGITNNGLKEAKEAVEGTTPYTERVTRALAAELLAMRDACTDLTGADLFDVVE